MDHALGLPVSVDEAGSAAGERLAALFERHHLRLWRLARRMAADADEAGDLVQETFLRAARHAARLPAGDGPAEGWLVRTLVNLCRDRGRRLGVRRARRAEALAAPAASANTASDPEGVAVARATVERLLAALPPRRRAVLLLAELEGEPPARIATLLGIGRATVRWHLSRARADLAAAVAAARPEDDP